MCMIPYAESREYHQRRREPFYAYKVVKRVDGYPNDRAIFAPNSTDTGPYEYCEVENVVADQLSLRTVQAAECRYLLGLDRGGFHLFLYEADAQRLARQTHNGVVRKVRVDPRDVLAAGVWNADSVTPTLLVSRFVFVEVEAEVATPTPLAGELVDTVAS